MTIDRNIRCITLGDTATGKTSLLTRIAFDCFDESYDATIGIDYMTRVVRRDGRSIKLQLWDTAGAERFRSIIASYFRQSQVCFLVYSLTNRTSFLHVRTWYKLAVESNFTGRFILVGTKYSHRDHHRARAREVSHHEGQELADQLDIPFLETSASEDYHVHTLVHLVLEVCREDRNDEIVSTPVYRLLQQQRSGHECCCVC